MTTIAETPTQLNLIPPTMPRLSTVTLDIATLPGDAALVGPPPGADLTESIRHFGVLQPIIVTVKAGSSAMIVVDGRRRLKAARATGCTEIPAILIETDDMTPTVVGISANALRSDNPASDLESIAHLLDAGASEAEISRATGLPIGTIRKRLRLRKLHPTLLGALATGHLKPSTAEAAAKLSPASQAALIEKAAGKKIKGTDVTAERRVNATSAVAALPIDLFDTPELEEPEAEEPAVVASLTPPWEHLLSAVQLVVESVVMMDHQGIEPSPVLVDLVGAYQEVKALLKEVQ